MEISSNIVKLIGELLGAALIVVGYFLIPKVKAWLEAKIGAANTEKLSILVDSLVRGAEQQFANKDNDGSIRNAYVKDILQNLGYTITDELNAIIESKVLDLNLEKKSIE